MSNQPKQTPLPDLLDQVPECIVLGIPGDEPVFPSYTNIPIGVLARQAADELRRLHAQREALLEALNKIAAIGNKMWGTDWEEIDEAREIARAAIKAVEGEKT